MPTPSNLGLTAPDFSAYSTDPARPDYACPAYREMAPRWQLVHDVREGTERMRLRSDIYLPKFEAEAIADHTARLNLSFANDHYATTVTEHTGLILSSPVMLGDDVPPTVRALCEDIDGEGNHIDVFATSAIDSALHFGHSVLYTDYPVTTAVRNRREQRIGQVRPYVQLFPAYDVLSWRTATVGGVREVVQVVLRERSSEPDGEFGVGECTRFREIKQEVFVDARTARVTGLGAITWRLWELKKDAKGAKAFVEIGDGTIVGPARIPARAIYGGEKLGTFHTKPHAIGLAYTNIEETQVQSDYAHVMHKCNVPTPLFIGRTGDDPVQMGVGLNLPLGADAKMLEPSGAALAATRQRLEDLRMRMKRQGATTADTDRVVTAAEAMMIAKQRNAKLVRAARSAEDALEGVLSDMAAFMKVGNPGSVQSGGSVEISKDFSGRDSYLEPAAIMAWADAHVKTGLPLEYIFRKYQEGGWIPKDADIEEVVDQAVFNQAVIQKRKELEAANRFGAPPAGGDDAGAGEREAA